MTIFLKPAPLTAKSFKPFGDVIETQNAKILTINEGTTQRYHDLAQVKTGANGRATINIFRGQPRPKPIKIRMMEKHPLGSQAFVPLRPTDYLLVVALSGSPPQPSDLLAFRATGHQGINYHPGVWHHPLLALDTNHDFLVIDRIGPGINLEESWFKEDFEEVQIAV